MDSTLKRDLSEVRRIIRDSVCQTSLEPHVRRFGATLDGGKMLRSQLIFYTGAATGQPGPVLQRAAAAVEMLHAASLLHDDIIDGGTLRRGEETFWVAEGTKAAVLMGDLLVSLAVGLVHERLPAQIPLLIDTMREMCDAEAEQEFADDTQDASWDACLRIAERKTGALFGFAAACAGGFDEALTDALAEAGRLLGTAYQLADDVFDASPDGAESDKSLGTDALTGKLTAASSIFTGAPDPVEAIEELLKTSEEKLLSWPAVQSRWSRYINEVVEPQLSRFLNYARAEVAT